MIQLTFDNLKNVLILVLIVVIILLSNCRGDNTTTVFGPERVITNTVVSYDTIVKEIPTYIPKIVTKVVREIDSVLITQTIDTTAILADYFATYVYADVHETDSLHLEIIDSISQNKILSRKIKYDLFYPTVTVTETEFINRREFYWGFGAAGTTSQLNYVGAQVLYKNKKKLAIGLGIGLDDRIHPVLSAQFFWKIGK